ncbi:MULTISPECIES: TonB-dependent receptor plug domain-containing protein [unclassified Tenacibaculum]|uniref:TonB-dependent receptor plug domain-containing protein n=1 Tax=unclassified Tenacibaculum TaxID=2635139 RepID=UPI001F19F0F8|nr:MULTISPECIES: TonB-dependent receptor plug domain-containing protein [unclassified Tenacibaculum]MCF2873451.1 TonB-dependent receptor plug domain-containing protein [Tenacibaculum sp. Cn5-1]MCF2933607.1 TonB-dependent receptor plug domain-containing protein [Tenacibaculum sp. Cn5-34]MCG7509811.1 TonB-dependent receptor plug domain-containing protein [Tenacibaculum sp. Cn5-46]
MKTQIKLSILLLSILFSVHSYAQKKEDIVISGYVKDSINKPVFNCSIFVDNIKQKKGTNTKGFYTLKLKKKPKKIMFFSPAHGFTEIAYYDHSFINVNFKKKGTEITNDHIVEQEPQEENKERFNYSDIYSYMRAKVPGLQILPDGSVVIRGVSTLNGSNQALFVLNKVVIAESAVGAINPNDVKSIEIIKGADATMYGVRGATGVISITTF